MTRSPISNALVGPYGLHAILALTVAAFVGFLYLFNFTSFF